ncbi:MAG: GTP-binding protein [Candidatus Odinarchaeum yellowstonii]|uniref:GTP-binding protein n=1 Tax=Odinarchaeota yellowstonii (strain LCB_4) TaxID=1841599 RepID=A0AAF0D1H3_ODILC|nr:MAG: GTP-binding protein [Candidatus Odinarchaeum yellowstonii]
MSKKYVFKLVVLGDERVGKTSLIFRYTERRFLGDYKPTIGIDFSAKLVEIGKYNVDLIIWDLGGQEKYRILRKHYLEGARGAILVFDLTNRTSFEHLNSWYTDLQQNCSAAPAILVGNKADLVQERKISAEEGRRKAEELGLKYLECSAKDGTAVDEAFKDITQQMIEKYVQG